MNESNQPETYAKRRHPTSRGMRKHVRERKRLGLIENHRRRKARLLREAWLARNPETVPISPSSRAPYTPSPPPAGMNVAKAPTSDVWTPQRVWVADLPTAKAADNLCPYSGCGHLRANPYESVYDTEKREYRYTGVRRCGNCQQLYRDFQALIFANLLTARDTWNDCPHSGCGGYSQGGKESRRSVTTSDAGVQYVCQCDRNSDHYYKPYAAPVRSGGWD